MSFASQPFMKFGDGRLLNLGGYADSQQDEPAKIKKVPVAEFHFVFTEKRFPVLRAE